MKMIKKGKNKSEISSKFFQKQLLTSNNSGQQGFNIDCQKFPSPTFNIHIHVPSYNASNSKIYLPRIQPEIHLHFDEIAKTLERSRNEQNKETLYRIFENLLSVASPRFGDVKFHFKNESGEKNFEESNESNETPCSTRSHCNDSQLSKRKHQERNKPDISGKSKVIHNLRDNKSTSKNNPKDIADNKLLSKYKDLSIKKAVVVLTDICKSKAWKNAVSGAVSESNKSQNEKKAPNDSLDNMENNHKENIENESYSIKQENESLTSSSLSLGGSLSENYVFDNCFENNCGQVKVKEIVVNASSIQESVLSNKSLTALAEGCSFSEILSRFRVKCNQYVVETPKHSKDSECGVKCNNEEGSNCFSKRVENNSVKENNRTYCKSHGEIHKGEVDLNNENVTSDSTPDFLFEIIKDNFDEKMEKSGPVSKSNEDEVQGGKDFEFSVRQCYFTDYESDKFNITSEKHLSSEVIADPETLKSDSSIKITGSNEENNFEMSKTKNIRFFDVGNIDFHLELINKEMQRRQKSSGDSKKNKTSNKIRIKSDLQTEAAKFDESSPPKRMKHSNKNAKAKAKSQNSSSTEDYIPLNASGPTKFAVAPLNIINPYKTHSAKTFKQEMLFGNRVARFSSSDQQRMYQLKQQAGRNSVKKINIV